MSPSFWLLDESSLRGLAEEAPDTKSERVTCPANEGHRRGGKRIGDLSVIVHPLGVKDFTWVWDGDVMISPRLLDLFQKHRVTGYEARRAKTAYARPIKVPPPELYELIVTGWGGFAAPAARVRLVDWCPACGDKIYSIAEPSRLIDPASWDGSDLFIVWPLPRYRFASDRLAGILRRGRISGIKLVPAAQIPTERGAKVGPATLRVFMPEDRARELERRFNVSHWLEPAQRSRSLRRVK